MDPAGAWRQVHGGLRGRARCRLSRESIFVGSTLDCRRSLPVRPGSVCLPLRPGTIFDGENNLANAQLVAFFYAHLADRAR